MRDGDKTSIRRKNSRTSIQSKDPNALPLEQSNQKQPKIRQDLQEGKNERSNNKRHTNFKKRVQRNLGKRYRIVCESHRLRDADPSNMDPKEWIDLIVRQEQIIPDDNASNVFEFTSRVIPIDKDEEEYTIIEIWQETDV